MNIKKAAIPVLISILFVFTILPLCQVFADKGTFHVAYIEGDPYLNYAGHLSGIARGLAERGYVESAESMPYSEGSDDAETLWKWLSEHSAQGIEFSEDDFYQLLYMTEAEQTAFVQRMNKSNEIDLLLVMGTAAAKFVKENNIQTDSMVASVTNAYASGIVEDTAYSGIDSLWAHTSPNRYYNQLNVFYNIFPFNKLGIVYEDSENGKNEISYTDIRKFAEDKKIELVEVPVSADQKMDGPVLYEEKMMEGFRSLAGNVDAVYMTNCGYRTPERIPEYLMPLYAEGIPVFSQTGKNDVVNGATLTIYRSGFDEVGSFCADRLVQIMEGKRPGELSQEYDESQAICINLAAAERAGLEIPFKTLLSADTIINRIGEDVPNE